MATRYFGYDLLPYGHLSWIVPVISFFATWFFLFPSFRCSLTVARSVGGDFEMWYGYWNLENAEYALALGPEEDSNVCYKWGKGEYRDVFDAAWKLGKSVGVIGSFTTIPAAIGNCVLLWSRFDLSWFYPLIALHIFNAFMSFMLLIGLRSKFCETVQCVLARAGYVAIIAGFFWLLVAILLFFVRRREAEMSAHPNGVDLKDIEDDEERLALPAPEVERLALPAPNYDTKKKKAADSSREVPLALPPSETPEEAPRRQNFARREEPMSGSNRTAATVPESPKPSSRRTVTSKSPRKSPRKGQRSTVDEDGRPSSPRKGTRPTNNEDRLPASPRRGPRPTVGEGGVAASPRKTPSKSPKQGSTTPSSAGTRKKTETTAKPNDIPEI